MRVTGCGPRLTARIEATRNDIYGPACSSRACMKDKRARANKAFDSQKMTTRTAGPVQGARGPGSERGQEGGREGGWEGGRAGVVLGAPVSRGKDTVLTLLGAGQSRPVGHGGCRRRDGTAAREGAARSVCLDRACRCKCAVQGSSRKCAVKSLNWCSVSTCDPALVQVAGGEADCQCAEK